MEISKPKQKIALKRFFFKDMHKFLTLANVSLNSLESQKYFFLERHNKGGGNGEQKVIEYIVT